MKSLTEYMNEKRQKFQFYEIFTLFYLRFEILYEMKMR